MAKLTRASSHKCVLLANGYTKMVSENPDLITVILSDPIRKERDPNIKGPGYSYRITFRHHEIGKMLEALRAFDLVDRLSPEEFQFWMKLTQKVLIKYGMY